MQTSSFVFFRIFLVYLFEFFVNSPELGGLDASLGEDICPQAPNLSSVLKTTGPKERTTFENYALTSTCAPWQNHALTHTIDVFIIGLALLCDSAVVGMTCSPQVFRILSWWLFGGGLGGVALQERAVRCGWTFRRPRAILSSSCDLPPACGSGCELPLCSRRLPPCLPSIIMNFSPLEL